MAAPALAACRTGGALMPMLEISGLTVGFEAAAPPVLAGIDLTIEDGETVALVGESGSGKSLTALSIMRLLPRGAVVRSGGISFEQQDVLAMPARRLNRLRGGEIAMLFQQPLAMLDPTATVGSQVAEAVSLHTGLAAAAAWNRVIDLFRDVGIPAPEARAAGYAHQLSGGMAQRVMIAAALAGNPRLLIADEPTTALDVTVQLQILQLLAREREARRLATLLITHDLSVVAAMAHRILVLYAGRVVEEGTRQEILERPLHPYTQALVRASLLRADADGSLFAIRGALSRDDAGAPGCRFLPRCATAEQLGLHARCAAHEPTLEAGDEAGHRVRCCAPGRIAAPEAAAPRAARPAASGTAVSLDAVSKQYRLGGLLTVRPLDQVSLEIRQGEVLGLVGESGCGKSTLARVLLHMTPASAGAITAVGHDYARLRGRGLKHLYRDAQLIFQDPVGALDPRMRLGESLGAALLHNRPGTPESRRAAVLDMLRAVGLPEWFHDRLPRECSGGQLQRAMIARALLMGPRLLVCDEPTSALDASIRAQILNLLRHLRDSHDLTMLMISHDLRVVRHLCDRVAVMYLGEIVEVADTEALFRAPAHPYTQALLAASLLEEHGLACGMGRVRGEPPSPLNPPPGCRYHTRCHLADTRCADAHPALDDRRPGHAVRCWHWRSALAEAEAMAAPVLAHGAPAEPGRALEGA
jgi:peptide/nickel transport system ATP-binding protein